jgi:hypothetical protein
MFGAEVRSPFQRSHSGRLSAALRRSLLEALLDEGGRNTLSAAVHLEKVPTQSEGLVVARDVTTDTLNRLAFNHALSIGTPRCTKQDFEPILGGLEGDDRLTGHITVAGIGRVTVSAQGELKAVLGLSADGVKAILEENAPAGESNYGLFRSARQSESQTEEFMHLYHIMLILCGDFQDDVDAWIKAQDPAVPITPTGRGGKLETVYTRLRNEFGHKRSGVTLDDTKMEMASHLSGLRELARKAIQLLP